MAGDSRDRNPGKRLLVLGAGPAQLGLLAAARARELYVIALDRDPSAPGFRYADRRAIVSTEDESGIERLASAGVHPERPPYAPGGLDNWENMWLQRSAALPLRGFD